MFEAIKILLLSAIYGVTSVLPISSLGHFVLLKEVLGCNYESFNADFYYALFTVGAGFAMYVYYFSVHTNILKNLFKRSKNITSPACAAYHTAGKNMLISFLPLLILYIPIGKNEFFGSFISYFMGDGGLIFVGIASLFCSVLMFISHWYIKAEYSEKNNLMSTKNAFFFGLYQIPAYILPGISHVGVGASRTALSDIDVKNVLKETYLYLAPAFMITGISRVVFYYNGGKGLNMLAGLLGLLLSFGVSLAMLLLINKCFGKKTYRAFTVYTLVFALIVTGTALYNMLTY